MEVINRLRSGIFACKIALHKLEIMQFAQIMLQIKSRANGDEDGNKDSALFSRLSASWLNNAQYVRKDTNIALVVLETYIFNIFFIKTSRYW